MKRKKILFIAAMNNFHFIRDIALALQDDFDITIHEEGGKVKYSDIHNQYDIVWLEWFDAESIKLLYLSKPKKVKYILRCHRYELFSPRTVNQINQLVETGYHEKIDKMVFVSKYIQKLGTYHFPWMENSAVLPNLIDHTKFPFQERDKGYNLLFLGRISYVKNLPIMLDYFQELISINTNFKLHIVGNFADPELHHYFMNYMDISKLAGRISFHGEVEHGKLLRIMHEMNYIVCTSIFESQGVGIIEAMAAGIKPIISHFPGARQFYPKKWLFKDRNEFVNLIKSEYISNEYHSYAVDKFSIQGNVERYRDLLLSL